MASTSWPQAAEKDLPEDGLALFINSGTYAIAVTPTMAKRPCIGCAKCCTVYMLGSFHTHLDKCVNMTTADRDAKLKKATDSANLWTSIATVKSIQEDDESVHKYQR